MAEWMEKPSATGSAIYIQGAIPTVFSPDVASADAYATAICNELRLGDHRIFEQAGHKPAGIGGEAMEPGPQAIVNTFMSLDTLIL